MKSATLALSLAISAALSLSATVSAVSTWQGGYVFNQHDMSVSQNWSGGTPTSSTTTDLTFPFSPSSLTPNQDIAPVLNIRSFNVTGTNYVFNGPGYAFSNPTSNTLSTGFSNLINVPFAFNGPTTYSSGNSELRGLLTGSAPLTVNGQMLLQPNTNNLYNGNVTLNNGSLTVVSGITTALHTPLFTINDASSLTVQGSNRLAGTPSVTFNNSASFGPQVFVTGSQTFNHINGNGAAASLVVNGGLTLVGNVSMSGGGLGVFSGPLIDLNGTSHVFSVPAVSDGITFAQSFTNGTFVKTGAGTVTLSSAATHNVTAPTVSTGLLISNPSVFANGGINNGTVSFEYVPGSINAPITGTGSVQVATSVTYNTLNTYSGGTSINGLASGALLGLASNLHGNINLIVGGSLIFNETAGSTTFSGTITGLGSLVKQNVGRSVLPAANTFTGSTQLNGGTLALGHDQALGSSQLEVFYGDVEAIGTRTIANPFFGNMILQVTGGATGSGNLTFSNTAPKSLPSGATYNHNSTGSTTYNGKFTIQSIATLNVNSGSLTLGDASAVNGFVGVVGSAINVNGGTLTLKSLNFISLPDVVLAGGTLNVPNGYAIPLGAALQGTGGVTGRVASANGSTIIASGALNLGDGTHPAGVNLDGELYTQQFGVTLNDFNQSVLGSLTQIGDGASNGSLTAPKGLVLNFGRNLTGRGNVVTNNTLSAASIINGDVNGDGPIFGVDALNFTGYVKGVGTFNNAYFSGTYAPGLSPALVTVGMIGFSPTNVLDIEIGGLLRGSQYDAIDATAGLYLGGTLQLTLINAFVPSLGNQFNLFDGPMFGTFSSYNFPALPNGWQWDTSLLYTQGIVQIVVPEPTSLAALGTLSLLTRRRRV